MASIPPAGDDPREVVLYVEDHPVNVLLMQTVFELRPELRLVVAVDGATALAAAGGLLPSLLLLDLRLPDCHGTQLLERLRALPGWADIPAIAVTAEAEFIPEGTTFSDVWHKPLRVPTLLARLDRVLAPRGTHGSSGSGGSGTAHRRTLAGAGPVRPAGDVTTRTSQPSSGSASHDVRWAMRFAF
jgi:CheY-like chemotaxis protein